MAQVQWKFPAPLQDLYDHWQSKRTENGGNIPRYGDIDLAAIPSATRHLAFLEVAGNGVDFAYRYFGSALAEAVGRDCTGQRMSQTIAAGAYLDYLLDINREVVRERRALFCESSFRSGKLAARWTSRLIMPLRLDGDGIDMLVAGLVFGGAGSGGQMTAYAASNAVEEGVRVLLD